MSSSKKKSTSHSLLPDGTKIKEYIVEETHPDGTRTITTTAVKTYKVRKTLPDGSQVWENVSTTTTTNKECSQPVQPTMLDRTADVLNGWVDMFMGDDGSKKKDVNNNKDVDNKSKATYNNNTNRNNATNRNDNDLMEDTDDEEDKSVEDVSTLGWTYDSRGAPSMDDMSKGTDRRDKRRSSRVDRWRDGVDREREQGRQSNRDIMVGTPEPNTRQGSNRKSLVVDSTPPQTNEMQLQPYQQQSPRNQYDMSPQSWSPQTQAQQQQQQQTPQFFQKTHPSNSSQASRGSNNHRQYSNNGNGNNINNSGNHNSNNSYNPYDPSVPYKNMESPLDEDGRSINTYRLYENDRCEELPTFHKVVPESSAKEGGRGFGNIIRSLSNASGRGINKNIKLGVKSASGGRGRQRSNSRGKNNKSAKDDKNVLDPEVIDAIELIRQRSKSPPRERRSQSYQRLQQQHQMQYQSQLPPLADQRQAQQDAIARQQQQQQQMHTSYGQYQMSEREPPMMIQTNNGHQQSMSPFGTPMYQSQPPTPASPMYQTQPPTPASPGQYHQQPTPASPGQYPRHQHDSSLFRVPVAAGQALSGTAGGSPGGSAPLPLGDLANPIQWDRSISEMRDDRPTTPGTTGAVRPSPQQWQQQQQQQQQPDPPGKKKKKQQQQRGKSLSMRKSSKKNASSTKQQQPVIPPAIPVKYKQALFGRDTTCIQSPPKFAFHKTNAILTSDKFVHFYALVKNEWIQTTTVSLPNTHRLSLALCNNTAVIGVPYDRNSKGLVTGAAYIFEMDTKSHTWYQVKKIVPKRVHQYATVGYSVDICDNVVCVGVPEIGSSSSGNTASSNGSNGGRIGDCGSVYVYQRAEQYKWMPMGHLSGIEANSNNMVPGGGSGFLTPTTSKFGTIVALRHKIMVVSNYQPRDLSNGGETSLFVYEYDVSLKNKWRLIQTDLLSTEGQRRNFGSHMALTTDGEGIFIGCHSTVNPTEILYYKRKSQPDMYGNRSYQLQQIITLQERCDIADFRVDSQDNFILGTLNTNRVYVYQQVHDLTTMENQGWRIVTKVCCEGGSPMDRIDRFGQHVGVCGDSVLVGSKNNVYSYSLEGWMAAKRKKKNKASSSSIGRRSMRSSSPSMRRRFMSTLSPMRFRH